jgi:pantothenate kinase
LTEADEGLIARVHDLLAQRSRVLIGITGAPGAGKSTMAATVAAAATASVVVPMDGFHRTTRELAERGWVDERGTPRTFDAHGYVELLRGLTDGGDVRAPAFDRSIEEPVPDAIEVPASTRLIVTEGNYLLLPEPPWSLIPELLDEIWFVDVDEEERLQRLIERHVEFGRTRADAEQRARHGSDADNARLVIVTRDRADRIVRQAR